MKAVSKTDVTQREWEDLAHFDPFWAVFSDNSRQFGRWDREEFFASGRQEINTLMKSCELNPGNNGRALDFGCGVGRLSSALRSYFAEVRGVDISEGMIRLAKEFVPECVFLLNRKDDLSLFENDYFDLVYSNIVLQHQRTKKIAASYIQEFVRIIKPGGIIVFQIPHKLSLRDSFQPRRRLYSSLKMFGFSGDFLYNRLHLNPMRTISLRPADVKAAISGAGGRLIRSYSDSFHRHSMSYVVTKGG